MVFWYCSNFKNIVKSPSATTLTLPTKCQQRRCTMSTPVIRNHSPPQCHEALPTQAPWLALRVWVGQKCGQTRPVWQSRTSANPRVLQPFLYCSYRYCQYTFKSINCFLSVFWTTATNDWRRLCVTPIRPGMTTDDLNLVNKCRNFCIGSAMTQSDRHPTNSRLQPDLSFLLSVKSHAETVADDAL